MWTGFHILLAILPTYIRLYACIYMYVTIFAKCQNWVRYNHHGGTCVDYVDVFFCTTYCSKVTPSWTWPSQSQFQERRVLHSSKCSIWQSSYTSKLAWHHYHGVDTPCNTNPVSTETDRWANLAHPQSFDFRVSGWLTQRWSHISILLYACKCLYFFKNCAHHKPQN